jgi:hypothetical protein
VVTGQRQTVQHREGGVIAEIRQGQRSRGRARPPALSAQERALSQRRTWPSARPTRQGRAAHPTARRGRCA